MVSDCLLGVLNLEAEVSHDYQGCRIVIVYCDGLLDVVSTSLVITNLDVDSCKLGERLVMVWIEFDNALEVWDCGLFVLSGHHESLAKAKIGGN